MKKALVILNPGFAAKQDKVPADLSQYSMIVVINTTGHADQKALDSAWSSQPWGNAPNTLKCIDAELPKTGIIQKLKKMQAIEIVGYGLTNMNIACLSLICGSMKSTVVALKFEHCLNFKQEELPQVYQKLQVLAEKLKVHITIPPSALEHLLAKKD